MREERNRECEYFEGFSLEYVPHCLNIYGIEHRSPNESYIFYPSQLTTSSFIWPGTDRSRIIDRLQMHCFFFFTCIHKLHIFNICFLVKAWIWSKTSIWSVARVVAVIPLRKNAHARSFPRLLIFNGGSFHSLLNLPRTRNGNAKLGSFFGILVDSVFCNKTWGLVLTCRGNEFVVLEGWKIYRACL